MKRTTVSIDVLTTNLLKIVSDHELCPSVAPYSSETMEADTVQLTGSSMVFCNCECHEVQTPGAVNTH
jgi:hypothetical protein